MTYIILFQGNSVLLDKIIDWALAAYKVAKKEKISKFQLKKFKTLLSLTKSAYEEMITKLLHVMKVDLPNGIKNKTQTFQAEIEWNGNKHRHKIPLIGEIVDRPKIRKLCHFYIQDHPIWIWI